MAVKHFEQFHQRQRRLGLAVLVARKGIHPAAENLRRFALIKRKLLAHLDDIVWINVGGVYLALKQSN